MEDQLYIVFAENIGHDNDEQYFYRLLFSTNPDIVWGDNFNVTPAAIVPDLEPDSSSISKEYFLSSKIELSTACESTCFSLQDCIDGIIALLFNDAGEKIVAIPFGMELDRVKKYIEWFGGDLKEVEYTPKNGGEDGEES